MILKKENIFDIPYKHIHIENFLPVNQAKDMFNNFPNWEDKIWENSGKSFKNEYGHKKELNDKRCLHASITNFLSIIETKEFIDNIEDIFGISGLKSDPSMYGGGLNLYPPGSELKVHTDFNFNSDLNMYRVVNLLFYLNPEIKDNSGGALELYDTEIKNKKTILPKFNSCVIFAPNNSTYHGVNKNIDYYRKSISIWYYSDKPSANLDSNPHKTKWLTL